MHTVEYYLALKINSVLIHATVWKDLENVLIEGSPAEKDRYYVIRFTQYPRVVQFMEKECEVQVTKG